MQQNKNTPSIRFAGFTDAWEQRKLIDETTEMLAGGDVDKNILKEDGKYPVVANALTNDGIVGYYDEEYRVKAPAVTVTGRGDVGHAKARLVDFTPVVRLLSIKSEHDVYFLENAINTLKIVVESTGVPQLTVPQLSQYELKFPQERQEEKQIGAFFQAINDLITLHQCKYDRLVNIKKSMLEKMFPKNGETVPEVRFAGFTDAWEQRKLGELIEDYVERTTVQNQYPVLTSSQQQGIVLQETYFADRQVTTNDNVGYFVLPKGYFTYRSRSDTDIFVFNRNDILDKGIISYYYPVFHPKNTDSDFLLRRLNHGIRSQLAMAAEGTGQKVLAHSKFKSMTVSVPKVDEQAEIGAFFQNLDRLITLHQRKLERLQNIKKACLEKMFV